MEMEGEVPRLLVLYILRKTFLFPPDLEREKFNLLFLGILLLWVGSLILLIYISVEV